MIPAVEVWTDLSVGPNGNSLAAGQDVRVGTARFSVRRSVLSCVFQYDASYLSNSSAYPLQPSIPLRLSPYHFVGLPGAFRDSAPDRWGRRIVLRELAEQASSQGVAPRTLDDADFLLGVSDQVRQGSLRFKAPGDSRYLSPTESVPPLIQLPRLLDASRKVACDSSHEELKELLAAGSSSLGGARPKAAVLDGDMLLIAKFPHASDEWDVMAWEKTMLDLAHKAGIEVPGRRLVRIGGQACLLLERFDRSATQRIGYLSAMSLTGLSDGDQGDYAEVGEAMEELVTDVSGQLEALFRRVVFSVAVHNTDDHLRNHGFLRKGARWELSPLFDVNPEPTLERCRATAIYGEVGNGEARGLVDLAASFGLPKVKMQSIVQDVLSAVSKWQTVAHANGCSDAEQRLFASTFLHCAHTLEEACGA